MHDDRAARTFDSRLECLRLGQAHLAAFRRSDDGPRELEGTFAVRLDLVAAGAGISRDVKWRDRPHAVRIVRDPGWPLNAAGVKDETCAFEANRIGNRDHQIDL